MNKLAIKQMLGLSPVTKIQLDVPTERHGSEYGGWTIIAGSLDKNSIVISAGIGNDISFDLSIIKKYDLSVIGIDPTPSVKDWLQEQHTPANFIFLPVGLSASDGEAKFYRPKNKNHISHSARPEPGFENDFEIVPMRTISTILKDYNLSSIDLLKIDIEGFEYPVIENILTDKININQLLIEFHHGLYGFTNKDTSKALDLLHDAGYRIYAVSPTGREVSMIKP